MPPPSNCTPSHGASTDGAPTIWCSRQAASPLMTPPPNALLSIRWPYRQELLPMARHRNFHDTVFYLVFDQLKFMNSMYFHLKYLPDRQFIAI